MTHIPGGNPDNAQSICVSVNAVSAHLAHGDYIGPPNNANCDENGLTNPGNGTSDEAPAFTTYPNPSRTTFTMELPTLEQAGQLDIYNRSGQLIRSIDIAADQDTYTLDVAGAQLIPGIYTVVLRANRVHHSTRIVVTN